MTRVRRYFALAVLAAISGAVVVLAVDIFATDSDPNE